MMVDFCQNIFWVNEKPDGLAKIYANCSGPMIIISDELVKYLQNTLLNSKVHYSVPSSTATSP